MQNGILRLRPHHMICLQHYAGRGYDDAFAAHMDGIARRLGAGGILVELTDGDDDVCAKCPNLVGGLCLSQEKVDRLDARWLEASGLRIGNRLSWEEVCRVTAPLLASPALFRRICGECVWFSFCARLRRAAVRQESDGEA